MKKRVIVFLTILALSILALVLSVSAGDIYSDFTQNGVNGEAPIFNFLGYSVDNEGGICVEYNVDLDALTAYESKTGKSLQIGFVAAHKSFVEGGMPLDPTTAKPKGENASKIITGTVSQRTAIINIRLVGLTTEQYMEEFILSLFTFSQGTVKYITDDTSTDSPSNVSYASAMGPLVATVNGMTYTTGGETELSWDRLRQMAESKAAYNTTTMTDAEAKAITDKSNLVITGGSLIGWSNAAKFLQHFHDGTGTQYNVNMNDFLKDSNTKSFRNEDINRALRAAEQLAREGMYLTVNQSSENLHKPSGDWYYAVGSYFTDVDLINLTVTVDENGVKHYSADIKYSMTDFYNWNKYDNWPVINKSINLIFTTINIVGPSPAELYKLHEAGRAQEFLTYGEITYSDITWTEGQTVSDISGLK